MTTGDELRTAMRRFPAGVAVLTLRRPYGMTVGSVVSVSLEPALVSISIGHDTQAHELIRDEGGFALNLLAGDQAALAQHFARSVPPIALFTGVECRDGARGPLLEGALAWFDCAVRSAHVEGDHTIFVAAVERIELGRAAEGLVYREGTYSPI